MTLKEALESQDNMQCYTCSSELSGSGHLPCPQAHWHGLSGVYTKTDTQRQTNLSHARPAYWRYIWDSEQVYTELAVWDCGGKDALLAYVPK